MFFYYVLYCLNFLEVSLQQLDTSKLIFFIVKSYQLKWSKSRRYLARFHFSLSYKYNIALSFDSDVIIPFALIHHSNKAYHSSGLLLYSSTIMVINAKILAKLRYILIDAHLEIACMFSLSLSLTLFLFVFVQAVVFYFFFLTLTLFVSIFLYPFCFESRTCLTWMPNVKSFQYIYFFCFHIVFCHMPFKIGLIVVCVFVYANRMMTNKI